LRRVQHRVADDGRRQHREDQQQDDPAGQGTPPQQQGGGDAAGDIPSASRHLVPLAVRTYATYDAASVLRQLGLWKASRLVERWSPPAADPYAGRMRIGIVGATGQVGEVMRRILAERNLPVSEL